MDRCTWISADHGSDIISIPTYVEDFADAHSHVMYVAVHGRWIGGRKTGGGTRYRLGVEIVDVDEKEGREHEQERMTASALRKRRRRSYHYHGYHQGGQQQQYLRGGGGGRAARLSY